MKKQCLNFIFLFLFSGLFAQESIEIKVDATKKLGKLEPFWASQIIHPTEYLLTTWGEDFLHLLKETGAARQYIRIYNQPENAIRVATDGTISYDWSDFDKMADLILATGNKLKVVIFSMPEPIAAHPEWKRRREIGAILYPSPPKDYKLWEECCSDFMEHVVEKYGLAEVKQWTFRCWNEPDHKGFWYPQDLEQYCKLYDYFAKAVKGVNPELRIGGPALTSTGTYENPENLRYFLNHVSKGNNYATGETGAPIDFIALHTYAGSGAAGGPGREFPALEYFLEMQNNYANMRDEFPKLKNMPIHVEEWGISSGGTKGVSVEPKADVRNSQYGAAFLTAWVTKHVEMKQVNDRNFESFTLCTSGYEGKRSHDFMGFRTLHTRSGFHKPLLNAYKMLDKLADEMVPVSLDDDAGHVMGFATKSEDKITFIVCNFQNDKIQNDGNSYKVTLHIETGWKSSEKVILNHWRIDEKHSNSYTAFKEIGKPEVPNPIQIDKIKSKMGLELMESPLELKTEQLMEIKFVLPCNAVSLIEIKKI